MSSVFLIAFMFFILSDFSFLEVSKEDHHVPHIDWAEVFMSDVLPNTAFPINIQTEDLHY